MYFGEGHLGGELSCSYREQGSEIQENEKK